MNQMIRRSPIMTGVVVLLLTSSLHGDEEVKKAARGSSTSPQPHQAVEVHFIDDSSMKLMLQIERLELITPYGKLLIPVADIQRIEFGMRVPGDMPKRIEDLIEDLGSNSYQKRESASGQLLALREKGYRHLLLAAKHKDLEVVRRAEELLGKIRESVPADLLEAPTYDVVYTENSKIAGHVTAALFKVTTFQFGDQELKLADLRSLRTLRAGSDSEEALADPGNLSGLQNQVGKTLSFKTTGLQRGNQFGGGIWGSGIYTVDSCLALAAVHAGVLRPGQAGVVRVTILGPQTEFLGSTRNGVTSMPYGPYSGYRIDK